MQFRDLGAQYLALKNEIDAGIQKAIQNHSFIMGNEVIELEQRLADYVGVKHCVACASGTDALILPLMAWGVGPGDAVFAPDFTYFATISCAMLRGAEPVLVDIDERTFNLSPVALEKAIQHTIREGRLCPKVIIPVDLFGQPAAHDEIRRIANRYGLRVLEDGAQGFGGRIGDRMACSFGDIGATSFFPAKPLGCYGDGGAIFTNDDNENELLRSLRAGGRSPEDKYDNRFVGLNSRLDTIQAAILLPKLKALHEYELDAVNEVAGRYTKALSQAVVTPTVLDGYSSSWAQYTILLKDRAQRDGLKDALKASGIPTMIYYPRGMHQQGATISGRCSAGDFPNTDAIVQRCLSLPLHPYMNGEDQMMVIHTILKYLESYNV